MDDLEAFVEKIKAAFAGASPDEIKTQLEASQHAANVRDPDTLAAFIAGLASGEIDPSAVAAPAGY